MYNRASYVMASCQQNWKKSQYMKNYFDFLHPQNMGSHNRTWILAWTKTKSSNYLNFNCHPTTSPIIPIPRIPIQRIVKKTFVFNLIEEQRVYDCSIKRSNVIKHSICNDGNSKTIKEVIGIGDITIKKVFTRIFRIPRQTRALYTNQYNTKTLENSQYHHDFCYSLDSGSLGKTKFIAGWEQKSCRYLKFHCRPHSFPYHPSPLYRNLNFEVFKISKFTALPQLRKSHTLSWMTRFETTTFDQFDLRCRLHHLHIFLNPSTKIGKKVNIWSIILISSIPKTWEVTTVPEY